MEKENNLVIIDADSMIYIIGSELEHLQLEPLGIIKLDEFISDILITTGSKDYLGFIGGKGRNFRKDIAITKPYKGTRPEKPEWFVFWQPILAQRMIDHWGFQPCDNIEADDACAIARTKYGDMYSKITIASPDKDLLQIPDTWFYDYSKRTTVYCDQTVSLHKFCHQLITGDSTDNIPGCFGAGPAAASVEVEIIAKEGLGREAAVLRIKLFYVSWHTVILKKKQAVKQEKEFLDNHKKVNGVSRLTAALKSAALKSFVVDTSMIMSEVEAIILFKEQYTLVKLIDNEEEAAKHNFILKDPVTNSTVDWDSIDIFHDEMQLMPEEEHFDFEDDL
jgi:5'-3' exonuclease